MAAMREFDSNKLSGRATVGHTRMDADGVLDNYLDGLMVDQIVEDYGVERKALEEVLAFAAAKGLKAIA